MSKDHTYIAIDLKSFYASVECHERGLDPLKTHLVVADVSRTEKTICLAVSPSLKSYGISGRARLFEVNQAVKMINKKRKADNHYQPFSRKSYFEDELLSDPNLELNFIAATPRMSLYMKYSTQIYNIYLRYIAPEDIHVYSIDEVFIDVTSYLKIYQMSAHNLAQKMIRDILDETGITATAGIGTNLFLAKVAMDIVAKHIPADENGVRIAELDEYSFRKQLWTHEPLTDFWRIGPGYQRRLHEIGLYTMGDIARCSLGSFYDKYNEDLLYKIFGINAELIIDHAWGYESCTIKEIKSYKPNNTSMGQGQVLMKPYTFQKGLLIVKEMTDVLVLDMVDKHLVTEGISLYIGYDVDSLKDPIVANKYNGDIELDWYGREVPKSVGGSFHFPKPTSSTEEIMSAVVQIYKAIVDKSLLVRRVNVACLNTQNEDVLNDFIHHEQYSLFEETAYEEIPKEQLEKEKKVQKALIEIHKRFGKNAAVKGMDLEDDAMTIKRNGQIGGHKA